MHHRINNEPTAKQSQVALSAATADLDNEQTDDCTIVFEQKEATTTTATTEKKPTSYGNKLFIHYLHEKRFRSFKRGMHQIFGNSFRNTPAMDIRLIVGNRNRRDAKKELIRKKPKPSLLQNKAKQIKDKYFQFSGKLSLIVKNNRNKYLIFILLEQQRRQAKTTTIAKNTTDQA